MNAREIAKFIKNAVKELSSTDRSSTYYLQLDDDFAIYVGWSGGFEPDDTDDYFHSKSQPEYCLCAKVAEWNPFDIDYEWMYMPWDVETDEVWDNETTLSINGNYHLDAKWLNKEYRAMRKALKEGKITFNK